MTTYGTRDLSVWLPGRGQALHGVSVEVSGLTLLTGRNGSGASLLLAALADRLPAGAMVSGTVHAPPAELPGHVLQVPQHLPDREIRDVVGPAPDRALLAALDVDPTSSRPRRSLDESTRSALCVAWAVGHPEVRLLLVDQPLARLRAPHRAPVVAALRRRADAGTAVLWAEHVLEDALAAADTVVELVPGGTLTSAAASWAPRTLPLPPHLAAARALGLPRPDWTDPAALAGDARAFAAVPRAPRHRVGDVQALARAEVNRLGRDLELRHRETVGVVSLDGDDARALDVARRLAAVAAHQQVLPHPIALPDRTRVDRVVNAWARRQGRAVQQSVLEASPLPLDPLRTTTQHSSGERAALRWALATATSEPALLVHPEVGLDANVRRSLATHLAERSPATTVLLSHDPEFLARACHRWVLLGADGAVEVGTPAVLAGRLPAPPVLRRAGLRVLRTRDLVGGIG